jgi:hypothetical protein
MKWRILTLLVALLIPIASPLRLFGQQDHQQTIPEEDAKATMSAQEWASVNKESNPVKRTRRWLAIAANRLEEAQTLTAQDQFAEATTLVKKYTTIISYALQFIDRLSNGQRKAQRSAYKEFDVRVRDQIKALNELKRDLPVGNQAIDEALFTAQRLRIIALNRFSGAEIIKVPEK